MPVPFMVRAFIYYSTMYFPYSTVSAIGISAQFKGFKKDEVVKDPVEDPDDNEVDEGNELAPKAEETPAVDPTDEDTAE